MPEFSDTALQPEIPVPLEVKSTVPVGAGGQRTHRRGDRDLLSPLSKDWECSSPRSCGNVRVGQAEDRAITNGSAGLGCAVEDAVAGLHQPADR